MGLFSDKQGRGFPSTVNSRTDTTISDDRGAFGRSFSEIRNPRGRSTMTMIDTPTFNSSRFIGPGGSGVQTINGVERPIQLTGGGQDFMRSGIMNNPIVGTIMEGYDKIEPYVPKKLDEDMPGDFYGYEAPVGPGTLTFGADRGLDNFYGGFQFSFEEGGIVDTPQMQDMIKKELSDEQKDYLYDFMLDFMFKQKQREQQEMEGNMPRFNYFDMEV
jgi:hypothetical protein